LKRKRLATNIYNLSTLQKAIVKTEAQLKCKIPPLLLIVIIQNGVLESILQLLVRNDIEVIVLSQRESGSVLCRKICVRKKLDGVVIMHAESRIKTKHLPTVLRDRIIEGEKGIGSLIEILRIETFRRIKNIGFDRRQRAIYRIYDIYIQKQLVITIKEYFPIDLPLWNSR
jgi:chorismate-pyruvate lyase